MLELQPSYVLGGDLRLGDQDISNAYIYLLGRLLVLKQQQLDFHRDGFAWNRLFHRKSGLDEHNPSPEVACSDAWVAIDEASALLVTAPEVSDGRYWTLEFLNGWGEALFNINQRLYPNHRGGRFAVCLEDSDIELPDDALRIDAPVRTMHARLRVEVGDSPARAAAIQHRFEFGIVGQPSLPIVPRALIFDDDCLPGVEAFDFARLALETDFDLNPGTDEIQADVALIAEMAKYPSERVRLDEVIRRKGFADFAAAVPVIGHGTMRGGWVRAACCGRFGTDWLTRSIVNHDGIWANVTEEVVEYRASMDASGARLDPVGAYTLTFPSRALPARFARSFWSVTAVDAVTHAVRPNPFGRLFLNDRSALEYSDDGSLTLWFAPDKPAGAPGPNWLPSADRPYAISLRFYGPDDAVAEDRYFPPPLVRI